MEDRIRKPTHLTQPEMWAALRQIGPAGVRTAMVAWTNGRRPTNYTSFRAARSWVVIDAEGNQYPHRPLIALAREMVGLNPLNPNNFGLVNDGVCRDWLDNEEIGWDYIS